MFNSKKLFALMLASPIFPMSHVMAADIEAGVVKDIPAYASPSINGETLDLSRLKHSEDVTKKSTSQDSVATLGSAQGISYFETYAVGSSNVGWEYPAASQFSTSYDHGGSQLLFAVVQYGYGNPNQATMNGLQKSAYSTEYLCGSMSNLHNCSAGETVTGFLYYFDFSGQQSGQFNTSTNSTASPFGYWSDSIYVN